MDELETLMMQAAGHYTMLLRELSMIPNDISSLKNSFYKKVRYEGYYEE